jgi:protein ImuB
MHWVAILLPSLPCATLESVAAWACQFTPKVSLQPPHGVLLEVGGSLRHLGGIEQLMARVQAGLAEMDFPARFGQAATPRAALWRAHGGGQALEDLTLEVACSGEPLELLRSIGIATLGELMRLPRDGLAQRCGQPLLDDLDRALGLAPEPREFFAPPARFAARLDLPAEVSHAEGLLFAARRLLVQLEGLLAARQAGIRGFTLTLLHQNAKPSVIQVGMASAARQAERLGQLLRERLAAVALTRPVEAICLEAQDFAPLHERSAGMFGDAQADAEDWARLIERLQARLGRDAVCGLTPCPDHRPELAWRRVAPGDWDPREFKQPGARPLWLVDPPRPIAQPELLAGPERIEAGWWDGDEARRDYFIARSANSSLLWVYREAGAWFLHGLFA